MWWLIILAVLVVIFALWLRRRAGLPGDIDG